MGAKVLLVAPKRQEKGKRISAPGDVNSRSDDDFGEMVILLTWRAKGKKKAKCTGASCRKLLQRAGICCCMLRNPASS
jgi:hypothetical protein